MELHGLSPSGIELSETILLYEINLSYSSRPATTADDVAKDLWGWSLLLGLDQVAEDSMRLSILVF
jgi:hypothetical protein